MSDALRSSLRLCLVTDRGLAGGCGLVEVVSAAVAGGVTMVQLREKNAPTRAFLEEARVLLAFLRPRGVPLLINDRADIALAVGADGVHVGQDDMPLDVLRGMLPRGAIVGLSITGDDDMARPDASAADYLGVGPIFLQATKADATPPLGLAGLARIRARTRLPIVAIGGLDAGNAADVRAAGADGLAVVSAIMAAPDPAAAARSFAR